ncbi:MAG: hypothetical protein VX636_05740 [Cyanobacteriota bacterium]|nr:hypothetical protein [Cyanobacteriota bacterium]
MVFVISDDLALAVCVESYSWIFDEDWLELRRIFEGFCHFCFEWLVGVNGYCNVIVLGVESFDFFRSSLIRLLIQFSALAHIHSGI